MTKEVLNIPEVAVPVRVAENAVYWMAQHGELPTHKLHGQWLDCSLELDAWIKAQRPPERPRK